MAASVPRALEPKVGSSHFIVITSNAYKDMDLTNGLFSGDLDVSLLKDMEINTLSPEWKGLSVISASSFELATVKHLDFPRMDNGQHYLSLMGLRTRVK
ncbi:hypothetical protein PoB_002399900 [Plakobranchus ocellatus]|uniref:Uncharacterized protein n=1 Tax=Plakobranchus ocellatus TaxID=259542 RepID=A0AAV3ZUA1_9GAST|nr:hypothetical protein PoB_002399900 [Plakobranchus ocellatus]